MAGTEVLGEEHVQLTLQLPQSGGAPLDEELLTTPPGAPNAPSTSEAGLSSWTAPGYVLDPSPAAKLLWRLTSSGGGNQSFNDANPSGVVLGSDIRFAADAVGMVVELLARGRMLPDLEFVADRWRACWRPLIDGRDRGRIEALVWALPASFTAARVAESNAERRARPGSGPNPATRSCAR